MQVRAGAVGLLLFGSGLCALVYQTVWLREFRLIFGASTSASAAVLAIFMGGLGVGGIVIGRRVNRLLNPLAAYGYLELGIAISAVATPLLLWAVRAVYLWMGGSFALGWLPATVVRLLFSVLVLALPTVLMGGTLPAAARAVEGQRDIGRLGVALLYATNALGAVCGALLSTFFLLERMGNLRTLIAAALANALIGMAALAYSNAVRTKRGVVKVFRNEIEEGDASAEGEGFQEAAANPRFVYAAAAIVGFAFFLMELVWYRMLAPLLGGTTYTFGLILGVALAGIGLGSFAYSLFRRSQSTLTAFALSCSLEALFIAVPFALGDRLAYLALLIRPLGALGFWDFVLGWVVVAAIVIFPAAFIAGLQFPILISLLGKGRNEVAVHVGTAYAWNTAGAIAGSIAGGFGLLPLLTAPGAWRLVVAILIGLAVAATFLSFRQSVPHAVASGMAAATAAVLIIFATGPTAFWRHTPIGTGRADMVQPTRNRLIDFAQTRRRTTVWERDGIESSVSIAAADGYAFLVNGKSDGHARLDAGTQVMGAILPALLHPDPKRAAIIGLGTGTTAGWMAAVPSIERVDAVEIEPAIVEVAELCAPVNHDVLQNPKAEIVLGDGREFLLVRGGDYDIISSEPSNPYRAGIANLFTIEFYRAVAGRLRPGGIFVQFLQGYEVDAPTIRTVYATMTRVFPHVETWQSQGGDLLLVATAEPIAHDMAKIDARLEQEPFRSAVRNAWVVEDAAGVYARYVCGTRTAERLALGVRANTDDRPVVEYAFARALGGSGAFELNELRALARSSVDDVPNAIRTNPAAAEIEAQRLSTPLAHDSKPDIHDMLPEDLRLRGIAQVRYMEGAYSDVWLIWQSLQSGPRTPLERMSLAEVLAERGDESAMPLIEALRPAHSIEADVLLARLRWRQNRIEEGAAAMVRALHAYRTNPWPVPVVMRRALMLINDMNGYPGFQAVRRDVHGAISRPFAIALFEELRKSTEMFVAARLGRGECSPELLAAIQSYEPHVPWQGVYLEKRVACYEQYNDPRAGEAGRDLAAFRAAERVTLAQSLAGND